MKAHFPQKTDVFACEFLYVQTRDLCHLCSGEMDLLTDLLGPNIGYCIGKVLHCSQWIPPTHPPIPLLPGRIVFLIDRGIPCWLPEEGCLLVLCVLRKSLPLTRTVFHLRDRSTGVPLNLPPPIPVRKTGWIHEAQSEWSQALPAHPTTGVGAMDTWSGYEL